MTGMENVNLALYRNVQQEPVVGDEMIFSITCPKHLAESLFQCLLSNMKSKAGAAITSWTNGPGFNTFFDVKDENGKTHTYSLTVKVLVPPDAKSRIF